MLHTITSQTLIVIYLIFFHYHNFFIFRTLSMQQNETSEWSVNRITDSQPTIFDVTVNNYFKSGRQLQQTATD